jgi:hypothetical protein
MSATEETSAPSAAGPATPDDANDLRGFHFKRLLGKPLTWVLIAIFAVAAGVAGAIFVGPAIAAAAAVGTLLLGLLVVFAIADSRAEDAFFAAYAGRRGLTLAGRGPLPPATPLLRKGDDRYAERSMAGPLATGVDGVLALYTYEDETTDSEGNRQTNYYRYTVGLAQVPECAGFVPELYCQRKSGLRALEKFEDVFRGSKERVKLESEALDKRYEIFVREGQDANRLRQLFSPTFIVWLTDSAPEKFAFELVDGTLCCYVHGHKTKAAELDTIRAASAAVAMRLRDETLE